MRHRLHHMEVKRLIKSGQPMSLNYYDNSPIEMVALGGKEKRRGGK